jgi:hypothetical protein
MAKYPIDPPLISHYRLNTNGESVGTRRLALSRNSLFLLFGAGIALLAIVGVSLQREAASGSPPSSVVKTTEQASSVPKLPPLTEQEEAFAEALWPLHQEMVEPSAGRLASAGMTFAADDHDANRLAAKLTPIRQVFHDTQAKVAAISVPASMQPLRDRYVGLLVLYEQSATEMLEVARDGDEGHLINAQAKSQHAAEELIRIGDILWPGEHKPN